MSEATCVYSTDKQQAFNVITGNWEHNLKGNAAQSSMSVDSTTAGLPTVQRDALPTMQHDTLPTVQRNPSPVIRGESMQNVQASVNHDLPGEEESSPDDVGDVDDVTERRNDTMEGLEWSDGVGVLPGTDLKFRMTEGGDLEMVEAETDDHYVIGDVANAAGEEPDLVIDEAPESEGSPVHKTSRQLSANDFTENKLETEVYDGKLLEIAQIKDESNVKVETTDFATKVTGSFYGIMNGNAMTSSIHVGPSYPTECLFCGSLGDSSKFFGRYCSKKCIAKNAGRHKRLLKNVHGGGGGRGKYRRGVSFDEGEYPGEAGNHRQHPKESGDLKIKIRLPSSGGPSEKRRKASIVSDDVESLHGKHRRQISVTSQRKEYRRKFSWSAHLEKEGGRPAPEEIFRNLTKRSPIPEYKNPFLVGHLLEAVDPMHQSLICLVSVVAVAGYRLRLHFEGFPLCFSFWANADSPLIFPCGFCEERGRTLSPPCGHENNKDFHWRAYAESANLVAAPEEIFANTQFQNKTEFRVNDKLEAVDRKHPTLTCVATVLDVIRHYVLIHFDGWNSDYDYWAISSSNYLRPVGWCKANGKELSPPLGFAEKQHFDWGEYLKEHRAADDGAFQWRGHGFEAGMSLEVIDRRNPVLLRVATIVECDDYRVKVHFVGWSDLYDDWFDADSPDLHPPNWGFNTEHPLHPPPRADQMSQESGCPIPGCTGAGHVRQDRFVTHHSEFGCPYSPQNLNRDPLPDRLTFQHETKNGLVDSRIEVLSEVAKGPKSLHFPKRKRGRPRLSSASASKALSDSRRMSKDAGDLRDERELPSKYRLRRARYPSYNDSPLCRAAFMLNQSIHPDDTPTYWHQHVKTLPGVDGTRASDVTRWSAARVCDFVRDVTGKREYGDVFMTQEIDGEALLMLTQSDISKVLKLKLGPSVKIYNAVLMFKVADKMRT